MEAGVRQRLRLYEQAMEQRAIDAVLKIDRSLTRTEERTLERQFRVADAYDIDLEIVDEIGFGPGMVTRRACRGRYVMSTVREMATVVCRVTTRLTMKGQAARVEPARQMTFHLARDGTAWFINSKY
jgi:hypothetical protein